MPSSAELIRMVVVAALLVAVPKGALAAKATCRPTDRTESGLQGQTTQAEVNSGANLLGFNCNVDLVGQYQGEGASWQLAAWKNCAYFDQRLSPAESHPGVVVVDLSDPSHPTPSAWLSDAAMIDPWQSLKVNGARQLLGGAQRAATGFAIYDLAADCAHPVLKSSFNFPGSIGHTGQWAPDGKTFYITPLRATPSVIVADTTDPTNPSLIPCGVGTSGCSSSGFFTAPPPLLSVFDDLEFSKDGNIAYVAMFGSGPTAAGNGLLVLDVSDFQQRRFPFSFRVIGTATWNDGSTGAQNALPITVAGRPYVLVTDQVGDRTCSAGKSANGFPRLVDVSDPTHPVVASRLMLEVADPANCSTVVNGVPILPTGPSFGYSCGYCAVDDADDAKLAACSCFSAGLRIFDIHDPLNPSEVAYFKPPAQATRALPASQYANIAPPGFVRNFDWTTAKPSFPKDRGMTSGDLWVTAQDNGFLVLRLDPSLLPDHVPPATSVALMPAANAAGWNDTAVSVLLTATDAGSGVRSIRYELMGAQSQAGIVEGDTAQVTIRAEGTTTISFFATDNAGNEESAQTRVAHVDLTPPAVVGLPAECVLWPPDGRLVEVANVTASDALSGLDRTSFAISAVSNEPADGDLVISGGTVLVRATRSGSGTGREYLLQATALDLAGNRTTAEAICAVPHDKR
jgi:hypothetical protein